MFRLCALGGLRLESAAGPLGGPAARPRTLALLAAAAVGGGRGATRDQLIGLLWPDRPEDAARHALAQSLYALRKQLGGADLFLPGTTVCLNPAIIGSDVEAFTTALDAGERDAALATYAGPFLDGFYLTGAPDFERWAEATRTRLEGRYRQALAGAAHAAETSGDRARAIERWEQLAGRDLLATAPVLHLARLLAAGGESGAAWQRLARYRAVLEAEGLPLAPEVLTLEQQLRAASRPAAPASAPVAEPAPRTEPASLAPASPVPAPAAIAPGRRARRHPTLVVALGITVAVVLLLTFGGARTSRPPIIAVGLIESHLPADSLDIASSLPDLLTTQLAQVPGLPVVNRARLLEILGAGRAVPTPAGVSGAARAAGAREIVEGGLYATGAEYRLDLRRVELAGGRVRGAIALSGTDPISLVERAADALAESYGLRAPPRQLAGLTSLSLSARRLYEEGLRAFYADDHSAAARFFHAALEDDSTFAMAAYYLAMVADGASLASASARWERAVRLAPGSPDRERLLIATAAAFHLNDRRALVLAESLAVRYPDDLDGLAFLGELRFNTGDFLGALAAQLEVARRDVAGRRGEAARCRACDALGRAVWINLTLDSLDAAERVARMLVAEHPHRLAGHTLLGMVLLRRHDFDGARAAHARQLALQPGSVTLREVEAQIAMRRGDVAGVDSLTRLMLAHAEDPGRRLEALEWRSRMLRQAGQPTAALAMAAWARHLADSLTHGGEASPFSRLSEALALLEMGRSHVAAARRAALLFAEMAEMPAYPEPRMARHRAWLWTHQATALARAGDTAALPALERAVAAEARRSSYGRDERLPHYIRGLLLEARGDAAAAAVAFARGSWSTTENHIAPRHAKALVAAGRAREAVRVAQAWLRGPLDAANQYVPLAEGHLALADAYAAAGQRDSARVHYEWVLRVWDGAEPAYQAEKARVRAALQRRTGLEAEPRIGRRNRP